MFARTTSKSTDTTNPRVLITVKKPAVEGGLDVDCAGVGSCALQVLTLEFESVHHQFERLSELVCGRSPYTSGDCVGGNSEFQMAPLAMFTVIPDENWNLMSEVRM